MSVKSPVPPIRNNPEFQREIRNLIITWGVCCCSSLFYLSTAYLLKQSILPEGLYPLSHDSYIRALIGLGVLAGVMQGAVLVVKMRHFAKLTSRLEDAKAFTAMLTVRTFTLLMLCELPVALGFCLFLLQGDLNAVFGFAIVSMLLYAQAHPRSANPAFP